MKTRYILSILAATAMFAGCTKENASENIPELGENQFFATMEDGAKTILNRETGVDYNKIFWENGDIVNINGSHYTVDPLEEDPRRALFTLVDGEPAPSKLPYMAYYPYQLGGLVLPNRYSYVKENPFRGVFPMFAISSGSRNLMFKNICGLLEIKLTGTHKITSINISDESKPLSGPYAVDDDANAIITEGTDGITIDCGETGVQLSNTPTVFYVPVPKGTYSKLTIAVNNADGKTWGKITLQDAAVIERNKVYTLDLEEGLPFGYTRHGYLQSNGGQAILTGYNIKNGFRVEFKTQLLNYNVYDDSESKGTAGNPTMFGVGYYNGGSFFPWMSFDYYHDIIYLRVATNYGKGDTYGTLNLTPTDLMEGTITINTSTLNATYSINSSSGTISNIGTPSSVSDFWNLAIFAVYFDESRYVDQSEMKLYYLKIYDPDGTLKRNFIPAHNEDTGKNGLYDMVEDKFYTNVAPDKKGDFTVGD